MTWDLCLISCWKTRKQSVDNTKDLLTSIEPVLVGINDAESRGEHQSRVISAVGDFLGGNAKRSRKAKRMSKERRLFWDNESKR